MKVIFVFNAVAFRINPTDAFFHQRRLILISDQLTLHFFLILRTKKRWRVSWTEIKVNLRWWNWTWDCDV